MAGSAQKTPGQRAATTLVAAVAPEFARVGGRYLEDGNEAETVSPSAPPIRGVRRWALDEELAARLWSVSDSLLPRHPRDGTPAG